MAESVLTWQAPVVAWAQWCRARFDVGTTKYPPVLLVAVLAGVAGALGIAVEHFAFLGCRQKPFSFSIWELTFSAPTFSALIRSAAACRGHVALSFATIDLAFPVFYSAFLCALYLWVERYRRFAPGATSPDAGSLRCRPCHRWW